MIKFSDSLRQALLNESMTQVTACVTQNADYPGVRPYVPPEMSEGDFRLMIYQTVVQRFTTKKNPTMSELSRL